MTKERGESGEQTIKMVKKKKKKGKKKKRRRKRRISSLWVKKKEKTFFGKTDSNFFKFLCSSSSQNIKFYLIFCFRLIKKVYDMKNVLTIWGTLTWSLDTRANRWFKVGFSSNLRDFNFVLMILRLEILFVEVKRCSPYNL